MSAKTKEAQSYIDGVLVARIGIEFAQHFRDVYPPSVAPYFMAVGPLQSLIGLAIKNGHLVPATEVAELREQLAIARAEYAELLIDYQNASALLP